MQLGVRAQEVRLADILAPGERLRMPNYQRSYSWGETEALDLLGDLCEVIDTQIAHFIGAVVFVRSEDGSVLEIVDGQQRLTTLTILICVLRDLETDPARASALHQLVADDARPLLGEGANWRLALNYLDGAFFRDAVQRPGATLVRDETRRELGQERDSQARIIANTAAFVRELSALEPDRRRAIAEAVCQGCAMVKVVVSDKDQGFKVFRVLNTRGKEPNAHDIIKTEVFQRARLTAAEASAYAEKWFEYEAALGGSDFDDLLRQIRTIHDRQTKGDLVASFQKGILTRIDPRRFLDELLPAYVKAYRMIETAVLPDGVNSAAISDCLHQMRALDQQHWRAPALLFMAERGPSDPMAPQFFAELERLAYVLMLLVHERDQRIRRLARVSEAIRNDRVLFSKSGPLAIPRDEARRARERLAGRFGSYGQRRAIALRLNAALAGGRTIPPESDATVEHVLPRNPPEDSYWLITWPDAARRREQCDTIGNFVLLTNRENQKADRLDYRVKKEIYFNGGGGQEFALTRDLLEQDAWTPEIVRRRTEMLATILADAWGL